MFQALRRVLVAASDFGRSRRFYGETLGLPEMGSFQNDWVEFGLGPVILRLIPLRPGEVPARNQVAAILSTDALDATLTTLKERGVTVTRPPQDEFTGRSAEILDPDGYRIICFQPSDLHPDEEWVPMSRVDEAVRQKISAWRQKEKARTEKVEKKAPPKKAAAKPKPKPKPKPKTVKDAKDGKNGKDAKDPDGKSRMAKKAPPKKVVKK